MPKLKPNRLLGATLLALVLLAGQVAMVRHQASHHADHPDAACALCLTAAPLAGGPVAVGWPLIFSTTVVFVVAPLVAAVARTAPRAASARAPPLPV